MLSFGKKVMAKITADLLREKKTYKTWFSF